MAFIPQNAYAVAVGIGVGRTAGGADRCFTWEVQELGCMFLIDFLVMVIILYSEPSVRSWQNHESVKFKVLITVWENLARVFLLREDCSRGSSERQKIINE